MTSSVRPTRKKKPEPKDDLIAAFKELAAQKKILAVLAPLSNEKRMRVLRAAAILHDIEILDY